MANVQLEKLTQYLMNKARKWRCWQKYYDDDGKKISSHSKANLNGANPSPIKTTMILFTSFVPRVQRNDFYGLSKRKGFAEGRDTRTSGFRYHNKLDTYITRYKNTFLLQSPLESCLAVCFALESTNFTNTSFHWNVFLRMLERTVKESRREEICDLRR